MSYKTSEQRVNIGCVDIRQLWFYKWVSTCEVSSMGVETEYSQEDNRRPTIERSTPRDLGSDTLVMYFRFF